MATWKRRFKRGKKKTSANWTSSEHSSETAFESSKSGGIFKASTTFEFKKPDGIEKIDMRAPFLSEFGGPIRGAVRIERHGGSNVRITMKGALESDNENEEGVKFFEQIIPNVEVDGNTAALQHAFAELTELPEHIRSVSMDFEALAPENVEIVLSEKASE